MGEGRPVPIHASGAGVVEDCIVCGLPYAIHDHDPENWLACPDKLLEVMAAIGWPVQGREGMRSGNRFVAPDNLKDWLLADNRYPQKRGRNAALLLLADLWWRTQAQSGGRDGE